MGTTNESEVEEKPIFLPTFTGSESDDDGETLNHSEPTEGEASVYFVVEDDTDLLFYRIPNHQLPPSRGQLLEPVFKLNHHQKGRSPTYAAVGSTIYVLGGGENLSGGGTLMSNDVYFIDAAHPEKGWRQAKPMEFARKNSTGFALNNKVYVLGGLDLFDTSKRIPMEAYDSAVDQWEVIGWESGRTILDYAVDSTDRQVFLYTSDQKLHKYTPETNRLQPCNYPRDYGHPNAIAVLGTTVYMGSYYATELGKFELIGYDLNEELSPVAVTGLENLMENRADYRLPHWHDSIDDYYTTFGGFKLIPIGEKKLAVVWALNGDDHQYFNCLKMEIDEEIIGPEQVRLTAHSGSFSSHKVKGYSSYYYKYFSVYSTKREVQRDNNDRAEDTQKEKVSCDALLNLLIEDVEKKNDEEDG